MTFNGEPIEVLEASLPGEGRCECGAPMRADGRWCTSALCERLPDNPELVARADRLREAPEQGSAEDDAGSAVW